MFRSVPTRIHIHKKFQWHIRQNCNDSVMIEYPKFLFIPKLSSSFGLLIPPHPPLDFYFRISYYFQNFRSNFWYTKHLHFQMSTLHKFHAFQNFMPSEFYVPNFTPFVRMSTYSFQDWKIISVFWECTEFSLQNWSNAVFEQNTLQFWDILHISKFWIDIFLNTKIL